MFVVSARSAPSSKWGAELPCTGRKNQMPVSSESNGPLAVSVAVAATLLGISRSHAYELAASGELPCIRLGRRVLVPMEEITRLLSPQPAPNRLS